MICPTCGVKPIDRARRIGECGRCYVYRYRNGKPRPAVAGRLGRSDAGKPRPHLRGRGKAEATP